MKKTFLVLLSFLAFVLASCNGVSPETAKAFKGEYWMETQIYGVYNNEETPLHEQSRWFPVSIYEKGGNFYVQTEIFGAPNTDKNAKPIEGYFERPDFAPRRVAYDDDGNSGIENVEITNIANQVVVRSGSILSIINGKTVQSLPIKAKSGSETVLNLVDYKPVEVTLTDAEGNKLGSMMARYEYGPMVKKDNIITWNIEYRDDYKERYNNISGDNYDYVIHKTKLYKR